MLRRIAKRLKSKLNPNPRRSAKKHTDIVSSPHSADDEENSEETLPEIEVDEKDLEEWLESGREFILVDIREIYEIMQGHLTDALMIPMNQIPKRMESLPKDKDLVIYCAAGIRSFDVGHFLRQQGFEKSWSLDGGVGAWAQKGYEFPSDKSEWKLTWKAEITQEAAEIRGIDVCQGTIQEIKNTDDGIYFTLAVFLSGSVTLIQDLEAKELKKITPPA